ncbi:(d)CMP kinase [Microlunatus flavus]|uniref:Cytidylate kinase n=1 Tax=Microlunatus flavus TaxID=1036181 RepID=A0A1H9FLL1_9ACTN|nr:(d)CMP kinase [Microlunatus flavus]SEQ38870.1 cytidylate kinase [Microlunatus flavus]
MPDAPTTSGSAGQATLSDTPLVVAIDGPSGSGKSSTARGVAERLGLANLDTGAMYRAAAWLAMHEGLDLADTEGVARLVEAADLRLELDPAHQDVTINGHDVTTAIREPAVSAAVSAVATNLDVRANLIARQRQIIAEAPDGIVAEGRDITTVVAPEAPVRVLLVADPAARVARRHAELGEHVDAEAVHDQVVRRDRDDSTVAAFHDAAPGVTVLDSTDLTLEQVVDAICALVPPAFDPAVAR